jgi:hypothetical protein
MIVMFGNRVSSMTVMRRIIFENLMPFTFWIARGAVMAQARAQQGAINIR